MSKKKKSPEEKKVNEALKKEIGERFKEFRQELGKTQEELGEELKLYQSTVANYEIGKTFPGSDYLVRLFNMYGLNIHWLFTGTGHKLVLNLAQRPDVSYIMQSTVKYGEPSYENYVELLKYMRIPVIERVILTKLEELKLTFKDQIKEFLDQEDKIVFPGKNPGKKPDSLKKTGPKNKKSNFLIF